MCAGALKEIGIPKVVFGAYNQKFGGNGSVLSLHEGFYEVEGGVQADVAIQLLKDFYEKGNPSAPEEKRHRPLVP